MPNADTSERKLATMLFVDLCGFTELSRTSDPEDVRVRTEPILDGLADIAARYGAFIGPTEGDGFLAIFGLPVAHDDDPVRAITAADKMRTFASGLGSAHPGIHAGLATGEVFATYTDKRWIVNGAAVNLASRLCDSAAEGEIMVDELCASFVAHRVEWQRRDTLHLKGFISPEPAYLLGGLREIDATHDHLIGRQSECQVLRQAVEDVAVTRRSRLITIVGEAGIGKTALAKNFQLGDPLSSLALQGRCHGFGGDAPLGPIVDALRRSTVTLGDGSMESTLAALGVKEANALSERWRYFIGDVEREGDHEAFAGRDGILQTLTRRLLAAIAGRRPTVLVIDDIHLASSDVLALLQSIGDDPIPAALLILATSREETLFSSGAEVINLGPLLDSEAEQIIRTHAGDIDDRVAAQLARRTGGNPLFLRECAALLRSKTFEAPDPGESNVMRSLPQTVRLVLAARLDGLTSAEKALLQAASTWGDEGPVNALELVGRQWMPEARRAIDGLFRIDDHGWRFAHSLVREVAYASVPKRERAQRHHTLLESSLLSSSQRAFHATAVVDLDVQAEEPERTGCLITALREVKAHAVKVYAIEARAAYDAVTRISELIERGAHVAPSDAFALLMVAASAAVELGLHREGQEFAGRAFMLIPEVDSYTAAAEAWVALGRCSTRLGNHELARNQGERALEIARENCSQQMAGKALLLIGETFRYTSFEQWIRHLSESFDAFEAIGDKTGCAEAARTAAYILSTGSATLYELWISRAKAFTQPEDLRGNAWIARAEAFAANDRGRWNEAARLAEEALSLAEEAGLRDVIFDARVVLLEACSALGRSEEVSGLIGALHKMLEREPDNSHMRMVVACSSARALQRWGSPHACDEAVRIALEIAHYLGDVERADCLMMRGDVLVERGDWAQARLSYSEVEVVGDVAEQPQLILTVRTRNLRLRFAMGEVIARAEVESLARQLAPVESSGNLSVLAALWPDWVEMPGVVGRTPEVEALVAEGQGRHEDAVWAWTQLGNTIWLANALDRVGNHERAQEVRDALRP